MKGIPLLLLVFALTGSVLTGQERNPLPGDTLAEVGARVVTARDLIERLELMPWPGKERGGAMDSVKIKALQSLVAEQILALESGAGQILTDSALRVHTRNLEKLMVRDELYKREVVAKTAVRDDEIRQGLARFASTVHILMIGARIRERARIISRAVQAGGSLDSVAGHPPGGVPLTFDSVAVTFGLLERKQEDAVYALSVDTPVSEPLETRTLGWVVLAYLGSETNPEYAKRSLPERIEEVVKKVRRRDEAVRASEFSAQLLAARRAEASPRTFRAFARTLNRLCVADSALLKSSGGYRLALIVDVAMDSLRTRCDDQLVEFEGGGMTVGEVLETLRTADFMIPTLEPADFTARLNAGIREIVEREFLAREGYRMGLDQSDEVRRDVAVWSGYWKANALMGKLVGDIRVSNDEMLEYLERQTNLVGHDYEVNVREVLSDSLGESLAMMERIVRGGDLKMLARQHSRRREWALRDGESGFFPIADHPEIGFRALDAVAGTLVGPVKVPEGYSLFVVLGRSQLQGETTYPYDSLKAVLRIELFEGKVQKRLNRYVASAAERYGVRLYYDRLRRTDIPPVNMVTKRMIGFGGSMLAVPSLYPLWEWIHETTGVLEVFP